MERNTDSFFIPLVLSMKSMSAPHFPVIGMVHNNSIICSACILKNFKQLSNMPVGSLDQVIVKRKEQSPVAIVVLAERLLFIFGFKSFNSFYGFIVSQIELP